MGYSADNVLVSVCMITYNHEDYIAQAIESVLEQETSFPYELVIGEDCSTDATATIVQKYAEKYPYLIKATFKKVNTGMMTNEIDILKKCSGRYVAMLEGDDCWTDQTKLQRQVDFLEAHDDYFFCFHDALIVYQNTGLSDLRVGERKIDETVDVKSVVVENNIAMASIMFRNQLNWNHIPFWYMDNSKADYGLVILLTENGLGKYLPLPMSMYRVHDGGIWNGKRDPKYHVMEELKFYHYLLNYFTSVDLLEVVSDKLKYAYVKLGLLELREGMFRSGINHVFKNNSLRSDHYRISSVKVVKAILRGIYHLMRLHTKKI